MGAADLEQPGPPRSLLKRQGKTTDEMPKSWAITATISDGARVGPPVARRISGDPPCLPAFP